MAKLNGQCRYFYRKSYIGKSENWALYSKVNTGEGIYCQVNQ